MLYFTSELKSYHIHATDGDMGKMKDIYFDDKDWTIRYAVLDTRRWLPSRHVLLSPTAFDNLNKENMSLNVVHDKETVRNSPEITEGAFISKDVEHSLSGYYGWSRYWMGNMLWGSQDQPILPTSATMTTEEIQQETEAQTEPEDYGLRSVEETLAFKVHANDGSVGRVADMVFDDVYWKLRYLVIRDKDAILEEGYHVIKPEDILAVEWSEQGIYVDGTLASLKRKNEFKKKDDIMKRL
jgi:hypothetical protein